MADTSPISLGTVLVTGGCGFVGRHIVQYLRQHEPKSQVHVLDMKADDLKAIPGVSYHVCDITISSDVHALFDKVKPQTVFHLASPNPVKTDDDLFQAVNVQGSRNVVAAGIATGAHAFINTASSSIIHDNVSDLIDADETYPVLDKLPEQRIPYTRSKAQAHKEILASNRDHGKDISAMLTASVLPAAVWGLDDEGMFSKIAANARAGRANVQMGAGNNFHDNLFISNFIDGEILIARALNHAYGKPIPSTDQRVDGEAFILANDEPVKFWDFSRRVAAAAGYPVKPESIRVVPSWLAIFIGLVTEVVTWITSFGTKDPPVSRFTVRLVVINRTFSCDKAKRILGYKPKISVAEGLERTRKYREENGLQDKKQD